MPSEHSPSIGLSQQLTASLLQRLPDAAAREAVSGWLAEPKAPLGLVVSERFVNMPPQLLPNLVDALVQDIDWAVENEEDKAERASFRFTRLLMLAPIRLPPPGGGKAAGKAALVINSAITLAGMGGRSGGTVLGFSVRHFLSS